MYFKVQIIKEKFFMKTSKLKSGRILNLILWRRNKLFTIKTYYKHYDLDRKWNGIWAIKIMRVAHSHILRLTEIPITGKHDLADISLIAIT